MRPRSVSVLTPPIAEPVTLYEAREHLRLSPDQTDDDSLVLGLLATARRVVERRLGQTLTATQYVATWTESPEVADLPYGPVLVDEDHALVVEADGDVVSSGSYEIESDVSSITFTSVPAGKMVVTYWAGAVPGSAIGPKIPRGRPNRSRSGNAQSPACGSKHCVVEALVRSFDASPDSSQWTRSGIICSLAADPSAVEPRSRIARS